MVILLHGLGGYAGEWSGTSRGLQAQYRVVALDQRGHGDSTRRPGDVSRAAYVNDVVAVAEALGLSRVTLVGQSMGGHTALLVAAGYPELVERLVLVESGVGGGGSALTADVAAMLRSWPVPFRDRAAAVEWFGGGSVGRAWADGLEQREDGLWPRFDIDVLVASLAAVHETEAWTEWEGLRQPTLLVYGSEGVIPDTGIDRMLETNPAARRETLEDADHDLHLEAEDAWLGILTQFLADTSDPTRPRDGG